MRALLEPPAGALIAGLTDCHAHLCDPCFGGDRTAVLERAREAGIGQVVLVGETLADAENNLELSRGHAGVLYCCAGLYPTHLDREAAFEMVEWIRQRRDELVGIGEVGLDHWKVSGEQELECQRRILGYFADLSLELDLPLNVHSRAAGRLTIEFLADRGARRVQMHAFDGKASNAAPGVEAGYYFSIPATVMGSPQKQKLVRSLPLSRLLIETDSPVLGPEKGERNEPANAALVLRAIAELKDIEIERVAEAVRANTRALYGI